LQITNLEVRNVLKYKGPPPHLLGLRRKSLNVYGLSMVGSSVYKHLRKQQIKELAHKYRDI